MPIICKFLHSQRSSAANEHEGVTIFKNPMFGRAVAFLSVFQKLGGDGGLRCLEETSTDRMVKLNLINGIALICVLGSMQYSAAIQLAWVQ